MSATGGGASEARFALSEAERRVLLVVARDALHVAVRRVAETRVEGERTGVLAEPRACFVTLRTTEGELRGCIGMLGPRGALAQAVREMTAAAALRDPRFPPVGEAELDALRLSLSVLGPSVDLPDPAALRVGEHGLVVERGGARGVLLPQVPVEQGWDRLTFLAQTCRKAGLPLEAWRDPATRLSVFRAEVFGE